MKFAIKRLNDELHLGLRGDITEASEDSFSELKQKIEVRAVKIDTEKVDLINSLGIRLFSNFISWLRKSNIDLNYSIASVAMVEAFNLNNGLCKAGELEKIAIPLHCEKCDRDGQQLIDAQQVDGIEEEARKLTCTYCNGPATITADLEAYTYFLTA